MGKTELYNKKKFWMIFLFAEILNVVAVLVSSLAISKGPVSLVKVIEGLQPIYVLLFAILLYPFFPKYFREAALHGKFKKIIFMIIMLFGLYLINL